MSDGVSEDGLLKRLAAMMNSHQAGGDDDFGGEGRRVPYSRFQEVVRKNQELTKALEGVAGEVTALKESHAAKILALQEQAGQQVSEVRLRHEQDLELVDAGLTDVYGRDVLRQVWDRAPKADRGKSPADFWKATLEAHKAHHADPENVQAPNIARPLTPYLPAIESPKETPAPRQQSRQRLPPAPGKRTGPNLDSAPTDSPEDFIAFLRKHEG